jgi:CRISPR-associated protein (TIGR02710 family)
MAKAFVQSVGTGTRPDQDITQPLLWHWRKSGAAYTVWIVSSESRRNVERMVHILGLSPEAYRIHETPDPDDIEATYRACRAVLRALTHRGFPADDIEVDYTSGTKAMTSGLALAAVAHRCGTLSYIAGPRSSGVVIGGAERLVPIEPRRIWADERLATATELCRVQRFDAARELLGGLHAAWLGEYETRLKDVLIHVAESYGAWDRFEYARAAGGLDKVLTADVDEAKPFRPAADLPSRLIRLKPERGHSPDRLADLFNNAGRRLEEGRYDDALARLYRLAEMLAQWILNKDFAIDTADVDVAKAPVSLKDRLEAHRSTGGRILLGLDLDYQVLKALDHPVGRNFDEGDLKGIGVLLKQRNVSLLAHGLTPICKNEVESLQEKLRALIALEVNDFDDRCRALEFPWQRGTASLMERDF